MTIERIEKNKTRLDRVVQKLTDNAELINSKEKGSIEVHFAGDSETISIKILL